LLALILNSSAAQKNAQGDSPLGFQAESVETVRFTCAPTTSFGKPLLKNAL
jgi:hypothetical protein